MTRRGYVLNFLHLRNTAILNTLTLWPYGMREGNKVKDVVVFVVTKVFDFILTEINFTNSVIVLDK